MTCCDNPECQNNPELAMEMKLEGEICEKCYQECRNCPQSEGYPHEEILYQKMAAAGTKEPGHGS